MLRRLVPATAAAALLLAGITGCSAQQSAAAGCEPALQPGALSDGVRVGGFGEAPEVEIPDGVQALASQRTVVERAQDRDRVVGDDTLAAVNMAFFDSESGKQLYASPGFADPSQPAELLSSSVELIRPLVDAVRCAAPGDRIVVAVDAEEGEQLGMQLRAQPGSALVGVIDVVSTVDRAANGRSVGLPNGYPAVTSGEDGEPGVVLAPAALPKGTHSALRIAGDGPEVAADDTVYLQLLLIDPEREVTAGSSMNSKVLASTWDSGDPVPLGSEEAAEAQGVGAIRAELTGKKVGSRVVIVTDEGEKPQLAVVDIVGVG